MQEAHGHIEGGAAPHLQAEEIVQPMSDEVGDRHHVVGAHARGQQRLMSVAEGRVGQQQALLGVHPARQPFGAGFVQNLPGAAGRLPGDVRRNRRRIHPLGHGLALHRGISVHRDVAHVTQQAGGAVAPRNKVEQGRRFFQPARGDAPGLKIRMADHIFQEGNVAFDAADAEFAQAAIHALAGLLEVAAPGSCLDEQGIIIRGNHGAVIGRAGVQANAEARRRTIGGDLAVIGREVVGRVLGRDAALQRVAVERHLVLRRQIHLRAVQFQALRHLNLGAHQINAGHHLGDGVLDLNARVDLDEEPLAGVGVHQEFDGAGAVEVGVAGQFGRGLGQGGAD